MYCVLCGCIDYEANPEFLDFGCTVVSVDCSSVSNSGVCVCVCKLILWGPEVSSRILKRGICVPWSSQVQLQFQGWFKVKVIIRVTIKTTLSVGVRS